MLSFSHQGRNVCLQGIKSDLRQCCLIWQQQQGTQGGNQPMTSLFSLGAMEDTDRDIPPSILQIVNEFDHLFSEPQGLPPQRAFDHTIPLISGVQPVNLRPYQYTPTHKDEIEKQVT